MSACCELSQEASQFPALDVVSRGFGGRTILQGVSLSLACSGITCLLGPSGCGKSTLLRVAAGLLPAEQGTVRLDPAQCAMVFQDPRLLPWLTVEENLALVLPRLTGGKRRQHIHEMLSLMELGDIGNALPRELSGGMAQRVGLARALLRKPQVLLMDEPFAALDAITRASLQERLVNLVAEHNLACLFVTHDLEEALRIGTHIHVLHSGHIMLSADAGKAAIRHEKHLIKQQIVTCLQQTGTKASS